MLWRHVTQNGASYIKRKTPFRWVFLQGIMCSQPEVSTTSGEKVMAPKMIFMFFYVFDLDLDISR